MPKHGSRKRRHSSSSSRSNAGRRGKRRRGSSSSSGNADRRRSTKEKIGSDAENSHGKSGKDKGSNHKNSHAARKKSDQDRGKANSDAEAPPPKNTKEKEKAGRTSRSSQRRRSRKSSRRSSRKRSRKSSRKRSRKNSRKSGRKSGKSCEKGSAAKEKASTKASSEKRRRSKSPPDPPPEAIAESCGKPEPQAGAAKALPALGDLAELQKGLERERSMLQLVVLKAKRELEDQKETKEKRERREREYFKAEFGEPCGPKNQLLLEDELGRGAFSTVFRCRDMGVSGKEYAIKFIRSNALLRKATEKEVRLMRRLRNEASVQDPEGARCFLGLAGPETFEHKGHLALVFYLQRCDLRSGLQKYGQGRGLPLPNVRTYARDIFMALRALKKVNVIHSDLKPDNLLMTLDKASVKLSDFGSAMDMAERIRTDYAQPRFYRAPEIILGQSYGTQIDMWSAGATLFELATGRILFTGRTNNGMIHEMLKTCGAFSKRFATTGEFAAKHFTKEGHFRLKDVSGEQLVPAGRFRKPSQPVAQLLCDLGKKIPPGMDANLHQVAVRNVGDLITKCVVPDPAGRTTPEVALEHRFFQKGP